MLTHRGIVVLIGSLLLYVIGALLGYVELIVIATGGALAVVSGVLWVVRKPRLGVQRWIEPEHVTRGEPAMGRLAISNPGRWRSAPMTAYERCGPTYIPVDVPPLPSGAETSVVYPLPTDRRAVVDVGPITVAREDPLGLCRRTQQAGSIEHLYVHPITHPMTALPAGRTRSLDGADTDQSPQGTVAFHSLREYVIGDDLRHVHWKSSARTGTLMVREHVDSSLPQLTLVFDTTSGTYDDDTFEAAVEIVASVAVAATLDRYPLRLITTGGPSAGGRGIASDAREFLDVLADIELTDRGNLGECAGALAFERRSDTLVVVTGAASPGDLGAAVALGRRYDNATFVVVAPEGASVSVPTRGAARTIRVSTGADFAHRWNRGQIG
jgi:uncharacterized protein (DUF58 family)